MNLLNKSPRFYGWTYMALIPVFAILYYILPKSNFKCELNIDSYITCLYYSTVTITTLGYGDISAISIVAQLLVIFETILGVTTIGLFLNSLSAQNSIKISQSEKDKEEKNKYRLEYEKLTRHYKLIEQNILFYNSYVYEITTPLDIRKDNKLLNRDFQFSDLRDLYRPSMNLRDDFKKPAIEYYFFHQGNLESSIRKLLLDVNFSYWNELENKCIDFLNNCKSLDFSSSILSLPQVNLGDKKGVDFASELISSHKGELKYLNSNMINQFIALFELINKNLEFIDYFQNKMNEIKNNCA